MLIWILFAALLGGAILAVLAPLGRRAAAPLAAADARAMYDAQMGDIARDEQRGLIAPAEAELARAEVARRLIRTARTDDAVQHTVSEATFRRRKAASALVLAVVPAVALALYGAKGSPHLPAQPLAARLSTDPARMDMAVAVSRVETHLQLNPTDGRGWEVLAPIYMRAGRYDDAARAFANIATHLGPTVDRLVDVGEARFLAAGGIVTVEARAAFDAAAQLGPLNPKGRYYLALAREQDGDTAGAVADLKALLASAPADANWRDAVAERIARIEGRPAGADAIASLPQADQMTAIRGMVEQLATRLDLQGGSAEEWARLIRAQIVLGAREQAAASLRKAQTALAADPEGRGAVERLAREAGIGAAP
jgi:cytochrome c-type biogenesis protein CcmH